MELHLHAHVVQSLLLNEIDEGRRLDFAPHRRYVQQGPRRRAAGSKWEIV